VLAAPLVDGGLGLRFCFTLRGGDRSGWLPLQPIAMVDKCLPECGIKFLRVALYLCLAP